MSIIITIISNITVLVSHDVICFGYFIPMTYSVNKKVPPIVPHPLTLPSFTRFVCSFRRNALVFLSLIAGRFQFCSFMYMMYMCFLGCFPQFCHHETANSFIFSFIHCFQFGLSSSFFSRKLSSRLILPP